MSRRIEIELTSALDDGSWTWRAAGARKPNGVLDASLLPAGSAVGDILKVEIEQMMDGIEVQSVIRGRDKPGSDNLIELLPSEKPFEAVIETRAKRDRSDRNDRNDRSDRRDGRGKRDGRGRDGGRDGAPRGDRDDSKRGGPRRPHFDAPPELPQRPKPKRLRPGKARRNEVLATLPEEQRPIAELALQGMAAVRDRVKQENVKLAADDKPTMPEASVVKMAEDLLPRLRVAEWLDRAEAAQRQMEHLDLRDLRSVIAASDDSIVARDESTRALAAELKIALSRKQDEELLLWFGDIDAAIEVGRVIRALRLSSQPPKAGVMFPPELARRLSEAASAGLQPDDPADRWIAVLEAVAFSPVRTLVVPTTAPTTVTDDLRATVLRLGPALPQMAALLGIEIPAGAPKPKPLRPQAPPRRDGAKAGKGGGRSDRSDAKGRKDGRGDSKRGDGRPDTPKAPTSDAGSDTAKTQTSDTAETPVSETAASETTVVDTPVSETPVSETPVSETPVSETPVSETPVVETPVSETPVVETPVVETTVVDTPVSETPVSETPAVDTPADDSTPSEA